MRFDFIFWLFNSVKNIFNHIFIDLIFKKSLKITTFSAGDLLRAEVKKPFSKQGKKISELIDNGNIVPASITIQLLLEVILMILF